jgi:hypothetical protein
MKQDAAGIRERRAGWHVGCFTGGRRNLNPMLLRMENHDKLENLSRVILRYLDTHTDAADTAEGISQWWVARQRYEDSKAAVERALAELVKQNLVKRSMLADGTVIYSRR